MTKTLKIKQDSGFTLTEMGVTIVISSIIAIVIGIVVVSSGQYFAIGSRQVEMQRDHSLILEILSNYIHTGISKNSCIYTDSATVETGPTVSNGSCLKVGLSSGDDIIFFKGGKDFVLITPSGTKIRLVTQKLNSLLFYYASVQDSDLYMNFDLAMSGGNQTISTEHTVFFRN
ncbi:MAG: hypothetical protein ISS29_05070 [Candidatus Marinimicrobia bacterium]|nr:hypothetical protein [Candidatus Neomarinimicrobiota bacterium]